MLTRVKMLKVKIKSLAAESQIIRLEERRAGGRKVPTSTRDGLKVVGRDDRLRCELWLHRTVDVRQEQRSALLAYAFLRGRPIAVVEPKKASTPDWARVAKLVEKFGVIGLDAKKREQAHAYNRWMQGLEPLPVTPAAAAA